MRAWNMLLGAVLLVVLGCGGERSSVSTPERGGRDDSGGSAGVSDAAGDTDRADASATDTAPTPDGSSDDTTATDTSAIDADPADTAGCVAGTRYCEGSDVVECQADGTERLLESCAAGCLGAACANPAQPTKRATSAAGLWLLTSTTAT